MTSSPSVVRDPGPAADAVARARARATTVALVDGPSDKAALLDRLARELAFPSSFGRNLDALEDGLRDLSWLPAGPVELVWADAALAAADPDTHGVVLEILRDAVAFQADDSRPLHVVLTGEGPSSLS